VNLGVPKLPSLVKREADEVAEEPSPYEALSWSENATFDTKVFVWRIKKGIGEQLLLSSSLEWFLRLNSGGLGHEDNHILKYFPSVFGSRPLCGGEIMRGKEWQ